MRPSIAAGVGVVAVAFLVGALIADGAEPVVSRPPQEARFRPVTLPSNSPMTPADPLAARSSRDSSWGASDGAPFLGFRAAPLLGPDRGIALAEDLPAPGDVTLSAPAPAPTVAATPAPKAVPKRPSSWRYDPEASWYGPGFYGKRTACGLAMSRTLVGVAHRSLPCGTLVVFRHAGTTLTVPVVDRGPYVDGRTWDLTAAAAIALDHLWTGPIEWRLQ